MKKILVIFSVIVGIFLFTPQISFACSCFKSTVSESFKNATTVFVGKTIGYDGHKSYRDINEPVYFTFVVSKSWKGSVSDVVRVKTSGNGALCGDYFENNKEYVVYARNDEQVLKTDLCSGNTLLSDAEKDIKELNKLGQLVEYASQYSAPSRHTSYPGKFITVVVLGGLVFLSGVLVVWKKKKVK